MAIKPKISKTRRNVLRTQLRRAILGDENGNVDVPNQSGKVYIRFAQEKDDNGNALYSQAVSVWHDPQAIYSPYAGMGVMVGLDENGELCVQKADRKAILSSGVNPRAFNPNDPQRAFVNPRNLTPALCRPVGTSGNPSTLVTVHPLLTDYLGDYVQYSGTQTQASKIDLASYIPTSGNHLLAIVWLDLYTLTPSVTASTAQATTTALDSTDVQECFIARPAESVPLAGFRLVGGATNITTADLFEDYRMWLNAPDAIGYENPLLHNTRIQSGWVLPVIGDYNAVNANLYVYGDLVNLSDSNQVSANDITGIVPLKNGGTGADMSATGGTSFVVKQSSAGATFTSALITSTELTSALTTPPAIGGTTPSTGRFTTLGVNDTPSATEQLAVQASSATVIPITIQANASQSANLLNVINSGGTVLTSISSAGNLMVRSTATPTGNFGVGGNPSSITTYQVGIVYAPTVTTGTTSGLVVQSISNPASTINGGNYGLHFQTGTASGNAQNWTSTQGGLIGVAGSIAHRGSGTITSAYGFLVPSPTNTGGGVITSYYGLKISSLTTATTNYAIFSELGLNELGDQLKINGAVDRIQLIVEGHSTQTSNLQTWQTSASTVVASVDNNGGAVFNEDGTSTGDVRIEGDTDANLLFTDASADSVGIKTATPNSRLQINGSFSTPIVSKSADYTATINDYTIVFTASAILNLPTAVGITGRIYVIKSGSGVTVTITPNGSETIDGNPSHSCTSLKAHQIQSDGANWWIISQY